MNDYEYFIREGKFSREAKFHGFAKSLDYCLDIFRGSDCQEMSVFNEKKKRMYFYERGDVQ